MARCWGDDLREAVFQNDSVQLGRQASPRASRGQATRASDRLSSLSDCPNVRRYVACQIV